MPGQMYGISQVHGVSVQRLKCSSPIPVHGKSSRSRDSAWAASRSSGQTRPSSRTRLQPSETRWLLSSGSTRHSGRSRGVGDGGSGPGPLALSPSWSQTPPWPWSPATGKPGSFPRPTVTPTSSSTARTASRRRSTTDKTASANPGLPEAKVCGNVAPGWPKASHCRRSIGGMSHISRRRQMVT